MDLYTAVSKITSIPANRLGLANKGRLNVGADADVTVFDPNTICDGATFAEPILPPVGISYVFVGGRLAAKDCNILEANCGTAVRG